MKSGGGFSLGQSLDLPALDRVDTLAQELALLQDKSQRRIAILGSRHVPVVAVHLIELVARSLVQEGHSLVTSGSQGVNAAVIRGCLEVDPSKLTVLLPQSLDRQVPEIRDLLDRVLHLVDKPEPIVDELKFANPFKKRKLHQVGASEVASGRPAAVERAAKGGSALNGVGGRGAHMRACEWSGAPLLTLAHVCGPRTRI